MSNRAAVLRFADFEVDPVERRLLRAGRPLDVQGRYFDALLLLARDAGKLISKERFFDEVWKGVPVTDEALTQCIRTLRRTLDDKSSHPRFIETVPRHGYRFIADVAATSPSLEPDESTRHSASRFFATMIGIVLGGGVAGAIGGIAYGFIIAGQPSPSGVGAASLLILIFGLTVLAALIGAAGVGLGLAAAAALFPRRPAAVIGGAALGGLLAGGVAKMAGLDAFRLLIGKVPGQFTGAAEGLILGAGVGLGAWLAIRAGGFARPGRALGLAALAGAASGGLIAALGLRLMGGSLAVLAEVSARGGWSLDPIGTLFGEDGFGPIAHAATAIVEGGLFAACISAALLLVRESTGGQR